VEIADGAAAMIDGLYLRQGLKSAPVSIESSIALTEGYLSAQLAAVAGAASPAAGQPPPAAPKP
jgi:TetR/AcrR family transcriptional regulator, transcriptional repressor of bet genes